MLRVLHYVVATAVALATLGLGGAPAGADVHGSVVGTVFDQLDAPMPGATVWLSGPCGSGCGTNTTDDNGEYHFAGLVPGENYCLAMEGPGAIAYCFTATDGTVNAPDVQLSPSAPGALDGAVTTASGSAVRGATVAVPGTSTTTDDAGGYQLTGLAPGVYTVTVTAAGYLTTNVTTTVQGGLLNPLDIQLTALDRVPLGYITWSRNDGRLVVGGYAKDDVGVLKVRVAVRDQNTDQWLHPDGSWGDYRPLRAFAKTPGARRTVWKFKRLLAPGSYGVSLVVVDTVLQRNPAPRPWLVVDVLP